MTQYRYPIDTAATGVHPPNAIEVWHSDFFTNPIWELVATTSTLFGRLFRLNTQGDINGLALTGAGTFDTMGGWCETLRRVRIPVTGGRFWLARSNAMTDPAYAVGVKFTRTSMVAHTNGPDATYGSAASYADPGSGGWIWIRMRIETAGGTPPPGTVYYRVRARRWANGVAEPSGWDVDQTPAVTNLLVPSVAHPTIASVGAERIEVDYFSIGTSGDAAPAPLLAPATPTVTVSDIEDHTAYATGSAFVPGFFGDTHASTQVRARRVSTGATLYAASLRYGVGPHLVDSLPLGPQGARYQPTAAPDFVLELLYTSGNGMSSGWGTSAAFQTFNLWESGLFDVHNWLEVQNGSGTFIALEGRYSKITHTQPDPNQPIATLNVDLVRDYINSSFAPLVEGSTANRLDDGVTYSPLFITGRKVRWRIALTVEGGARPAADSSLWIEMFYGRIEDTHWPQFEQNKVTINCTDLGGGYSTVKTETEQTYVAGTSLEASLLGFLTNNGFVSDTVTTPTLSGKVITIDYTPGLQKPVWDMVWETAQSVGWLIWFAYGATGRELRFFSPQRTKTVPDYTLRNFIDVNEVGMTSEEIRNVGYLVCSDENGERITIGPFEDTDSITRYGDLRRVFWINVPEDSPVRSSIDGSALLNEALSDVSDPDVLVEVVVPFAPFIQNASDLVTLAAQPKFFDYDLLAAPFGVSHDIEADQENKTTITMRGAPSAGARVWLAGPFQRHVNPKPTVIGVAFVQTEDQLVVTPTGNVYVKRFRVWARQDTSPKVAGVPLDDYSRGEFYLTERTQISLLVTNGSWHVLVRGFDKDDAYSDRESTVVVSGIGGDGDGGTAPTTVPGIPTLTLDAWGGGSATAHAEWINPTNLVAIQIRYFLNGVLQYISDQPAGTTIDDPVVTDDTGKTLTAQTRYTQGVGLAGPWSGLSDGLIMGGGGL
jgi:hypothetical protein